MYHFAPQYLCVCVQRVFYFELLYGVCVCVLVSVWVDGETKWEYFNLV